MHRRSFLDLARYAALAAVIPTEWRVRLRPSFRADPFALGVASGDPTATSVNSGLRHSIRAAYRKSCQNVSTPCTRFCISLLWACVQLIAAAELERLRSPAALIT